MNSEYGFHFEFGLRSHWLVVETEPDQGPWIQKGSQKRKKYEEILSFDEHSVHLKSWRLLLEPESCVADSERLVCGIAFLIENV